MATELKKKTTRRRPATKTVPVRVPSTTEAGIVPPAMTPTPAPASSAASWSPLTWVGVAGAAILAIAVVVVLVLAIRDVNQNNKSDKTAQAENNEPKIALQYELFVPKGGCSEVVDNTDRRYSGTSVEPKNKGDAYPPALIVRPGGLEWVPYFEGARFAKIQYCGSPKAMTMVVTKYK